MRIAIITGASSGLGREYVRLLQKKEPQIEEIWAIARRKDRLEELKDLTKLPVRALPFDLTDPKAIDAIEALYKAEQPQIALLINAAGFGKIGSTREVGRAESDRMVDLNCRAAMDMTAIALPFMKKGSRIMEICSTAAFQPFPYLNVYAASKAFLFRYARGLQRELRGEGIAVTAVCPYWIKDTEFIPTAQKTPQPDAAIRRFPLASRVKAVAKVSLADSRSSLAVSTPGLVCTGHRALSKFLPDDWLLDGWEWLRKL